MVIAAPIETPQAAAGVIAGSQDDFGGESPAAKDLVGDVDSSEESDISSACDRVQLADDDDDDEIGRAESLGGLQQDSFDEESRAILDKTTRRLGRLLLDDDTPKISLVLPIDDLSTLEARFARRQQLLHNDESSYQEQQQQDGSTANTVIGSHRHPAVAALHKVEEVTDIDDLDLPSYYFEHDFDDTVRVLESLPWRCLPDYCRPDGAARAGGQVSSPRRGSDTSDAFQSSEWDLWEESMVTKLCELDTALECVNSNLLCRIQPHQGRIDEANTLMHEFEQNLRLAFMYWDRSNQALEAAVGSEEDASGLVGQGLLLGLWDRADDYIEIQSALDELAAVLQKERDLFQRIDSFDTSESDALNEYFAVSELSSELEKTVREGRLSNLECLDELRDRLGTTNIRFWKRLLSLSESVVVRSCRQHGFDWIEYERLVKAVLDLHSHAFDAVNHVDVAKDWSQSVLDALCHEANRALAYALLEPTDCEPSEYEKELAHYSYEFSCGWGDDAKLRTLIHNLVTIRFCFESDINYLPRVFHKLLVGLFDVLHTHHLFTKWHTMPFDERSRDAGALHDISETQCCAGDTELTRMLTNLKDSREFLWRHCESVIDRCLNEYLDFANRPKFFQIGKDGIDDSVWFEDLEGLHQVLCLSDRFLALKGSFFGDKEVSCMLPALKNGDESSASMYEKLGLVFRRHLRSVHVEAMEAMGRMLAHESWILTRSTEDDQNLASGSDIEALLVRAFRSSSRLLKATPTVDDDHNDKGESWLDRDPFALFLKQGNPFGSTVAECFRSHPSTSLATPKKERNSQPCSEAREYIYQVLSAPSSDGRDEDRRLVAPACVSNGLIQWFSRFVDIIALLPPIVEDVSAVFANLCDLYFTTVFRICCGCSKNERILLGVEPPSPFVVLRQDSTNTPRNGARDARSPIFSSFRKSVNKAKGRTSARPPSFLPNALEAEICSPLLKDIPSISRLRDFLVRAQDSLRDVVNLDKVDSWLADPNPAHRQNQETAETLEEQICGVARLLEKRQGAIWSCFAVAALADVTLSEASSRLASAFLGPDYEDDLLPLTSYTEMMLSIAPDFAAQACRFSCLRAIGGYDVVKSILRVGAGWEECKLHENANDYVDDLGDRCALIWGFLCVSAKLPFVVRKTIWAQLVSGSYLALLEGFARVPFCSTEGRALMALDLASFSVAISSASISDRLEERALIASPPPPVKPDRSESYVDTYVKVFYYPAEDVLSWIESNHKDYQLGHSIALITSATTSTGGAISETAISEMLDRVMEVYGRKKESQNDNN